MKKILILDDDLDLLRIVQHVLQSNGYSISTLDNPGALLPTLESLTPDLLILDLDMGAWDGSKISSDIKSNPAYVNLPILIFSGERMEKQAVQASGADAFLQKPITTESFLKKIEELLSPTQTTTSQ